MEEASSTTPLLRGSSSTREEEEEGDKISQEDVDSSKPIGSKEEEEEEKGLVESEEEDEQSPIEQVALTVPTADDPSMPVLTFRMWVLGVLSCVVLSFLNQFFWYRTEPLTITAISAQIAVLPLGRLMAATISERKFFAGSSWEFSFNPGPFNMKEHVLITIFANSGAGSVYAIHIVSAVKIFYKKKLDLFVAFLIVITTQILGFGWAGIFRRYLVEPAAMWWPANLVQVSLFSNPTLMSAIGVWSQESSDPCITLRGRLLTKCSVLPLESMTET